MVAVPNNVANDLPLGLIAGGTLHAAQIKGLLANATLIGVQGELHERWLDDSLHPPRWRGLGGLFLVAGVT